MADIWQRTGQAQMPHYVELGPGRGTLAADALRAMEQARLAPVAHFVETSPVLRAEQRQRVPHAHFHDAVETLPRDRPLLIVANEFFDALPIQQAVKTETGWREMMVGLGQDTPFAPVVGERPVDSRVPEALRDAPSGSIYETSPTGAAIMLELSYRLQKQGGAMIAIDYGYAGPALGDTLQALYSHQYTNVFGNVGEIDLTAHVDFSMLIAAALQGGLTTFGPTAQGDFLTRLGIHARAQSLTRGAADKARDIETALTRLVSPEQMGTLFKVMMAAHPAWPVPEGFA